MNSVGKIKSTYTNPYPSLRLSYTLHEAKWIFLQIYFQHLTSAPAPVQDATIPTVLESSDNLSISTEVADDHALRVLKSIFHHSSFRGKQREAINVIVKSPLASC